MQREKEMLEREKRAYDIVSKRTMLFHCTFIGLVATAPYAGHGDTCSMQSRKQATMTSSSRLQ